MINDIIAIIAKNYKKFLIINEKVFWIINELKKRLFKHYHDWIKIFNFKAVNKLLFHRKIDYNINLQLKIILSTKKIYELFREQILIIKTYIDNMRQKEFIRYNFSSYAALILIVKKSNENLRICVNYWIFNNVIIKNRNASFLLRNTLLDFVKLKFITNSTLLLSSTKLAWNSITKRKLFSSFVSNFSSTSLYFLIYIMSSKRFKL